MCNFLVMCYTSHTSVKYFNHTFPTDFVTLPSSRWTMRMLVRLLFGLFVLKAAVASPRFSRQAHLDTYSSTNYDDNFNLESDYEDVLTIGEPQVRNTISFLSLCKRKCMFQAFKPLPDSFAFNHKNK